MSRTTNAACPVCGGKGFIGEVAERRARRCQRPSDRRGRAPAATSVRTQPGGTTTIPAAPATNAEAATEQDVARLARVLLHVYRGDREVVAGIFTRFAAVGSHALGRVPWQQTAREVLEGRAP